MGDYRRKALLYLGRGEPYWRLSPIPTEPLFRPYPLDFETHLRAGHYSALDGSGIPVGPGSAGFVHNYTRILGFALAHLQAYQRTRSPTHIDQAILAADYVLSTASHEDGLLLRADVPGFGHQGTISAMAQGQAMSVLTRLFELTREESYFSAAIALLPPFGRDTSEGGVRSQVSSTGTLWFEEDVVPPIRHILNGMIFAVWGLRDLWESTKNTVARDYYELGVRALADTAPRFDMGWWSLYDIAEIGSPSVASANYHQLHICQLTALGRTEGIAELIETANAFARYANSVGNRLRAGAWLAFQRVERRLAR